MDTNPFKQLMHDTRPIPTFRNGVEHNNHEHYQWLEEWFTAYGKALVKEISNKVDKEQAMAYNEKHMHTWATLAALNLQLLCDYDL